jgi:hypothetical protein
MWSRISGENPLPAVKDALQSDIMRRVASFQSAAAVCQNLLLA